MIEHMLELVKTVITHTFTVIRETVITHSVTVIWVVGLIVVVGLVVKMRGAQS